MQLQIANIMLVLSLVRILISLLASCINLCPQGDEMTPLLLILFNVPTLFVNVDDFRNICLFTIIISWEFNMAHKWTSYVQQHFLSLPSNMPCVSVSLESN